MRLGKLKGILIMLTIVALINSISSFCLATYPQFNKYGEAKQSRFSVTLTIPKKDYTPGEEIKITGIFLNGTKPAANATIFVALSSLRWHPFKVFKQLVLTTDDNGVFKASLNAPLEYASPQMYPGRVAIRSYSISVHPWIYPWVTPNDPADIFQKPISQEAEFYVYHEKRPYVEVRLDRPPERWFTPYTPGEIVRIRGSASGLEGPLARVEVSGEIWTWPVFRIIDTWKAVTDNEGKFAYDFVIPPDAPPSLYLIDATYGSFTGREEFEVLPSVSRMQAFIKWFIQSYIRGQNVTISGEVRIIDPSAPMGEIIKTNAPMNVKIFDPNGKLVLSTTTTTDDRGWFHVDYTLSNDALHGFYAVYAKHDDMVDVTYFNVMKMSLPLYHFAEPSERYFFIGQEVPITGYLVGEVNAGIPAIITCVKPDGSEAQRTVSLVKKVVETQRGKEVSFLFSDSIIPDQAGVWFISAAWPGDENYQSVEFGRAFLVVGKPPEVSGVTISEAKAHVTTYVMFERVNPLLPIVSVIIVPKKNLYDIVVTAEELPGRPPEAISPSGIVFGYFDIKIRAAEEDLETVDIQFKVPRTWLDKQGVDKASIKLLELVDNRWEPLPTSVNWEDPKFVYYLARAYGRSIYAIVGEKAVPIVGIVPAMGIPFVTISIIIIVLVALGLIILRIKRK